MVGSGGDLAAQFVACPIRKIFSPAGQPWGKRPFLPRPGSLRGSGHHLVMRSQPPALWQACAPATLSWRPSKPITNGRGPGSCSTGMPLGTADQSDDGGAGYAQYRWPRAVIEGSGGNGHPVQMAEPKRQPPGTTDDAGGDMQVKGQLGRVKDPRPLAGHWR